ncbi:polysaccharide export protein [Candidatus Sumerlaeota bacterium]|nr:polysaccharide export protein [Candidatus Sumerlaeota bacterium]
MNCRLQTRFPFPLLLVMAGVAIMFSGCIHRKKLAAPIDVTKPVSEDALNRLVKDAELHQTREQSYRIGSGDVISIQLVGRTDILGSEATNGEQEFTITDNPMLALPNVGAIRVHGKTATELQDDLKVAYSKWIIDPQPLVIIKKFQANQIAVLGTVKTSGKYPLDPGDTLLDALFKAGGLNVCSANSGQAPGRYLIIYRETLDRQAKATMSLDDLITKVNEGTRILPREEITVPIDDYMIYGKLKYNIPINPNDIIYVPSAGSVSVRGTVDREGIIFLGPSMRTISQIVTQAGLRFGASSKIVVIRRFPDAPPQAYYMNVRRILDRTAYDFYLQDQDEVLVDGNPIRLTLEWLGGLVSRGTRAGVQASYNPVQGAIAP